MPCFVKDVFTFNVAQTVFTSKVLVNKIGLGSPSFPDHLFYDSDTILSALSLTSLVNSKQTSVEARGHDTRKKEQEGREEWRPKISYNGTDQDVERLEEAGESSSGQQKPGSSLHARPMAVDGKDIRSRVHYIPLCTVHGDCQTVLLITGCYY